MGHGGGDDAERNQTAGSDKLLLQFLRLPPQLGFALAQNFLDPLFFGQISRHYGEADQIFAFIEQRRNHRVRPKARAVLAHTPSFLLASSVGRGVAQRLLWKTLGLILCSVKASKRLADDFLVLKTFDPFGAGIPRSHPALRVEHEDRIVLHAFDQKTKALFALLDRLKHQTLVDMK